MKILSPAGNFESLKMAVFNGTDEVYLGINNFNARNNIDGFTLENLEKAVDFAHIFGVKVNLAINILFSDDELQGALDTIVDSYNLGVDCFIIQDLGLASLVHKYYPDIEIHASTQMGIHNLEGVKAIEKYGFKRVVLARETPLEEIKRIRDNSDIEIEYFAQGALCVSFSGNCYLSSYLCNASGNRGKCKQLCRLPYTLEFKGNKLKKGYLLSAKDFNMIDRLDDLKQVGVDVLKIEGRARRPAYVAMTTREYYKALHKKNVELDNLKLAFNRGYTAGYFDGNGNIISDFNNHVGIKIGRIERVNIGKRFNEIYFSSNRSLSQKSTFKVFRGTEEKNTLSAFDLFEIQRGKYKMTTTQKVCVGDEIFLILDFKLEDEMSKVLKKKEIKIKIYAKTNEKIKAEVMIDGERVLVEGGVLQSSKNQPLTKDVLESNFNKSEIFNAQIQIGQLDDVFIPSKVLNEFRRNVLDCVRKIIIQKRKRELKKIKINKISNTNPLKDFKVVDSLGVVFDAKNIIYSPEVYDLKEIKRFQEKCKSENKIAFLDLPNFALEKDIEFLKEIINEIKIAVVVNNYYALGLFEKYVIGAGLNVYNSVTANVLGVPFMLAEGEMCEKIKFPYMTFRHCPMKSHLGATCAKCSYKDGFAYKMDNGKVLKLKRKKLSTCTFYLV